MLIEEGGCHGCPSEMCCLAMFLVCLALCEVLFCRKLLWVGGYYGRQWVLCCVVLGVGVGFVGHKALHFWVYTFLRVYGIICGCVQFLDV